MSLNAPVETFRVGDMSKGMALFILGFFGFLGLLGAYGIALNIWNHYAGVGANSYQLGFGVVFVAVCAIGFRGSTTTPRAFDVEAEGISVILPGRVKHVPYADIDAVSGSIATLYHLGIKITTVGEVSYSVPSIPKHEAHRVIEVIRERVERARPPVAKIGLSRCRTSDLWGVTRTSDGQERLDYTWPEGLGRWEVDGLGKMIDHLPEGEWMSTSARNSAIGPVTTLLMFTTLLLGVASQFVALGAPPEATVVIASLMALPYWVREIRFLRRQHRGEVGLSLLRPPAGISPEDVEQIFREALQAVGWKARGFAKEEDRVELFPTHPVWLVRGSFRGGKRPFVVLRSDGRWRAEGHERLKGLISEGLLNAQGSNPAPTSSLT